jgi:hypothetical protein
MVQQMVVSSCVAGGRTGDPPVWIADVLGRVGGMVRTAESNYRSAVSTNKSMWPVR